MSSVSVTTRAAAPGDAAAIAAVHLAAHRETYGPIFGAGYDAPDLAERERQWRDWLSAEQVSAQALAFVAEIDAAERLSRTAAAGKTVVGFIHAEGAHLTSLYVLASYQRLGIGQGLLAHLLAALHRRGHGEATFHVLPSNRQAVAFYERQGARHLGYAVDGADGKMQEDLLFAIRTDALAAGGLGRSQE